jgi:hypothetical protein
VARLCVNSCAKKGRRTNAGGKIIAAELGTQLRKSVTIDWTLRRRNGCEATTGLGKPIRSADALRPMLKKTLNAYPNRAIAMHEVIEALIKFW